MDHDSTECHQCGRWNCNRIRQGNKDRIYRFNNRRCNDSDYKEACGHYGVNNAEKFFNEADPVFTGSVTGLVADGDLGSVTYVRTNDASGVGTYEKVLDAVYTDNTNYEVTVKRGDFKIKEAKDPEAELKIAGGSWIYDGKEHKVKLDVIDSVLASAEEI